MICKASLDSLGQAIADNMRALKTTKACSDTSTTIYANDMDQPTLALPSTTIQPMHSAQGRQKGSSDDESVRPTQIVDSPSHPQPFFNPPTLESTPCSSTTTQNTTWMQPAWTRDLLTMNPTQYILTENCTQTTNPQLVQSTHSSLKTTSPTTCRAPSPKRPSTHILHDACTHGNNKIADPPGHAPRDPSPGHAPWQATLLRPPAL